MLALVLVAVMAVLGAIIMMQRLNLRRFLGYPNLVDISFTILMLVLFAGTFSGMVAAGFAALFMSVTLGVLRSVVGAERLAIQRVGLVRFRVYWKRIEASECQPHWFVKLFSRPQAVA
jgi:hypothetical protein